MTKVSVTHYEAMSLHGHGEHLPHSHEQLILSTLRERINAAAAGKAYDWAVRTDKSRQAHEYTMTVHILTDEDMRKLVRDIEAKVLKGYPVLI